MISIRRFQAWMAAGLALMVVAAVLLTSQGASAQVGRAAAIRSAQQATHLPISKGVDTPTGSGAIVMDGDWLYIVRGARLYKVQKSTMSVFQTVDLN